MKLVYFASLRERLGLGEEEVALPDAVRTVADVIAFLSARDELYADVFASGMARAALDKTHAKPEALIAGAREIAIALQGLSGGGAGAAQGAAVRGGAGGGAAAAVE